MLNKTLDSHRILELSLLLKGAHAIVECLGGLILAFTSSATLVHLVGLLTQQELTEDPQDRIAGWLLASVQHLSVGTEHFYSFYLLSHGILKLAMVVELLRGRHWAYPASLWVLGFFVLYQLYRYSFTHSVFLLILTVLDVGVMVLIWIDWRRARAI